MNHKNDINGKVSLKDFLIQRIDLLEKLEDERFEKTNTALELQAKEYERRLNSLNGEAERLRYMQSTYMPREVYESKHNELTTKIEGVQKITFIGIGLVLAVEFFLQFVLK